MIVRGDVEHLVLPSEIDRVSATDFERDLHRALERGVRHVVLHLDAVRSIDEAGLDALLGATEAAELAGADLRILPGPDHVMSVVEAAGLSGRLPFVGYP